MEYSIWIICIIFACNQQVLILSLQSFQGIPSNKTSVIGETVYFHCSVNNKSGELQWIKDGFGLGMPEDIDNIERYSMIMSDDNINFDLEIRNVTLDDEGAFQCQVGPGVDGSKQLRSEDAFLAVEVPTSSPVIIQGGTILVEVNKEAQLDCISTGGKPAAEVLWIDDIGMQIQNGVEIVEEMMEDEKRVNIRSVLRFQGKLNLDNKTFTCQAHNKPSSDIMIARVQIHLGFAPAGFIEVKPVITSEYGNFQAICHANASPPVTKVMWYLNGHVLHSQNNNKLVLFNVTREFHESLLSCYVENDIGTRSFAKILSVSFGPRFRIYPQNVHAEIGTTFTLYCDANGNPTPMLFWKHEPSGIIVHHGNNYTDKLTYRNHGNYSCFAQVQGYAAIHTNVSVSILGPPKIISKAVQFGTLGEKVIVECAFKSTSISEFASWTRFGHTLLKDDLELTIINESFPYWGRSIVVLNHTKEEHFGEYTCTVTNSYGTDSLNIHLIKQLVQYRYFTLLLYGAGTLILIIVLCAANLAVCLKLLRSKDKPNCTLSKINDAEENVSGGSTQIGTDITGIDLQQDVNRHDAPNLTESPIQIRHEPHGTIQDERAIQTYDGLDSVGRSTQEYPSGNRNMEFWDRGMVHYINATTNVNAQHAHTSTPTRMNCPSAREDENEKLKHSCEVSDSLLSIEPLAARSISRKNNSLDVIAVEANTFQLETAPRVAKIGQGPMPPPLPVTTLPTRATYSSITSGLGFCFKEIQKGVKLKPTKIKRSITLGPTEGLGGVLANALALRKNAVNPESCSNSSVDDKENFTDDWQ